MRECGYLLQLLRPRPCPSTGAQPRELGLMPRLPDVKLNGDVSFILVSLHEASRLELQFMSLAY